MGYIDVSYQTVTFLLSIALGATLCVFYDILRVLHKHSIKTVIGVFVSDILFWLVASVGTFFFLILRCNGRLRSFVLIGIFIGFTAVRSTVSRFVFWFFDKVMGVLVGILHFVSKQIGRIFIHINKISINSMSLCKKLLQPKVKLLYNHLRLKCGRKRRVENGGSN